MMSDAIQNFAKQFAYQPIVENTPGKKPAYDRIIVAGMGGSHLAADLALVYNPSLPLVVHSDYGLLSSLVRGAKRPLVIASSYSGNTEETIDAYKSARRKNLPVAVITVGGKLLAMAKRDRVPYVQMPNTGIQPRSALGFNLRALFALIGDRTGLSQSATLARTLKPQSLERAGRTLAQGIKGRVPVIYSSRANRAIAYNWKIKFNETGKIPAFYNVLPELNHNEMTGFDVKPKSKHLSQSFHFVFLADKADHARVQKRMKILERLYRAKKLPVTVLELKEKNIFEKIFISLVLADWAAVHTAALYGLESEQVPMVEEFKKLMK